MRYTYIVTYELKSGDSLRISIGEQWLSCSQILVQDGNGTIHKLKQATEVVAFGKLTGIYDVVIL